MTRISMTSTPCRISMTRISDDVGAVQDLHDENLHDVDAVQDLHDENLHDVDAVQDLHDENLHDVDAVQDLHDENLARRRRRAGSP